MKMGSVLYNDGKDIPLAEKELTEKIIHAAIEVHKALGPGLLESAYQTCIVHESKLSGLSFEQQVPLVVTYKGVKVDGGYRLDLVYEKRVVVELKAVEEVLPVHIAQLMTYLKLTGLRVGLLLNFNVPLLKNGLYRRIL